MFDEDSLFLVARLDGGAAELRACDGTRMRAQLSPQLRDTQPEGGLTTGDRVRMREGMVAAVLPRRSQLLRHAAGTATRAQAVAANMDLVLITAPLGGRWQPRRVERALALAWSSGAVPVVLLTKADLSPTLETHVDAAESVAGAAQVLAVSTDGTGVAQLRDLLSQGTIAVLIGPSGAGKSTLVNLLAGEEVQRVNAVRDDGKGRHTTVQRELIEVDGGALLIDTPGTRALGLWDAEAGIDMVFGDIIDLAARCRFSDCAHDREPGCAVREAGRRDPSVWDRLQSWRKLQREQARLDAMDDPRAGAARRRELRQFALMVRSHYRDARP